VLLCCCYFVVSVLLKFRSVQLVAKEDTLTYDIGNLTAFDYASLDGERMTSERESYLRESARDNVQLLFTHLWK
jgi:hypothetical protein